ncbi:MAG: diguanylate cyclase [Alkalibacterium sp.]|nr:diguanylate cyclase [Alkalibacterium sp.]
MKLRWGRNQKKLPFHFSAILDGLCGGIMGVVLMTFSVELSQGTIVDFRYIPIILMVVFIGNGAAAISTLLIGFGRFIFGISLSGMLTFFISLLLLAGLMSLNTFWKTDGRLLYKASLMSALATALYTTVFIVSEPNLHLFSPVLMQFSFFSIVGGVSAVFLMNYLRTSEYLLRKYEIESSIDFLTGLKNVRKFNQLLDHYSSKAKLTGSSLSVAMIDIDHFKSINDRYGHAAGDFVLMEMSRLFEEVLSKDAYVCRKGGEEFAVIFPAAQFARVITLMERCRKRVENHPFEISDYSKLFSSVSVGISQYPSNVSTVDELCDKADEKLYRAKEKGRNIVMY